MKKTTALRASLAAATAALLLTLTACDTLDEFVAAAAAQSPGTPVGNTYNSDPNGGYYNNGGGYSNNNSGGYYNNNSGYNNGGYNNNNSNGTLVRPYPRGIRILDARYGREGNRTVDVTNEVENFIYGFNLKMEVTNANLGITPSNDPAVGKGKKLFVHYRISSGEFTKEVGENDQLYISDN